MIWCTGRRLTCTMSVRQWIVAEYAVNEAGRCRPTSSDLQGGHLRWYRLVNSENASVLSENLKICTAVKLSHCGEHYSPFYLFPCPPQDGEPSPWCIVTKATHCYCSDFGTMYVQFGAFRPKVGILRNFFFLLVLSSSTVIAYNNA